ncbi:conserved hypothetical protein [Ricinus communis]|uniref:Uncharacterized protein n=1 Tax=Ricinus communis TaxID=3988 RepID=B9S0X4_RICCO|nr:conserved hypothetical protein [Ricinus communis]
MENKLSKILIFGATGYIGKYMVKASILLGHKIMPKNSPHYLTNSSLKGSYPPPLPIHGCY